MTEKTLQTISFNLIQDIVTSAGMAPDQQVAPGVWYQHYELIRRIVREDLETRMPDTAIEEAVEITLVYTILNESAGAGETVAEAFAVDVLLYERKIDDWFRKNLGLDDVSVPFQAPIVIRFGLDGKPLPE